eukprot:TRINITY_DN9870_c0_g1_i1.p1 TRINITY_DN9870_c0_g1~~TRINITY_DN9870_c0_g1_i1.p1  ORF type:complete len:242 (-),score=54.67 TRINITY_DN9870_c0_g1_i1:270-995(-)
MKTVGLVGGLSFASTLDYYRIINEEVGRRQGGMHSAELVLISLDLHEYIECLNSEDPAKLNAFFHRGFNSAKLAGAQFAVICSNTGHKAAPYLTDAFPDLPMLHIADCTAKDIQKRGLSTVGFIGTSYTMTSPFLVDRLRAHGLDVLVPTDDAEITEIHRVIIEELSHNVVKPESRPAFTKAIAGLVARGAEAVVLGCTEIQLIVKQTDCPDVPLFDTVASHVAAIVDVYLGASTLESYLP